MTPPFLETNRLDRLPAQQATPPRPDFDHFYCTYIKGDAAKEPITTGESIPAIVAKAAEKTGRTRGDFEVEEISRERHEKLKQFLF